MNEQPSDDSSEVEVKRNWWVFFPVRGLIITDEMSDLSSPMFFDATLISRQHLPEIREMLRAALGGQSRDAVDKDVEDIAYTIDRGYFGNPQHVDRGDSLLSVRRLGGNRPTSDDDRSRKSQVEKSALERAYTLSALLTLAILTKSEDWTSCHLSRQQYSNKDRTFMLSTDERGGYSMSLGFDFYSCSRRFPLNIRRQELAALLRTPNISPLANMLAPQRLTVAQSLFKTVREAAVILSNSLHGPTSATPILGSVTALEILMIANDDNRRFDVLKSRVKALIGDSAFESYRGNELLNARHLYVHQGQFNQPDLAESSIGLAVSCLLNYARLCKELGSKGRILAYLDYLAARKRFVSELEDPMQIDSLDARYAKAKGEIFPYFVKTLNKSE